jgi:hypothetical protein
MGIKRLALAASCGCALALMAVGAAAGAGFTPGSPGLGDLFFPFAGNGGYDVSNYSLTLGYTPATNQLSGTAVISAKPQRRISPASTSTCAASRSPVCSSTVVRPRSRAAANRSS